MKHLERALQGKNGIGRYIALLLIAFIGGSVVGSIPMGVVMIVKAITSGGMGNITPKNSMDLSAYGISNNVGLILMLFTFVAVFFTFVVLVKPFHGRSLKETINGRKHIRWNRIWVGIIVWGALLLISLAISLLTSSPDELQFRFNPGAFIGLLLIVLIILPFQTSIEEILFRGYLAQGVGRRTKSRWWALIIPSILFALMHSANPEVIKFGFWITMPDYLLMGLMLGLISILDDGIEIALGIHFINNAFAALFITHEASALQTDALFLVHDVDPAASLIETAVLTTVAVAVFWRIYKWNFGIMNKRVEATPPPVPSIVEKAENQEIINA